MRSPEETVGTRTLASLERILGQEFLKVLHDPKTIEIMLNADGNLWVDKLGEGMSKFGIMTAEKANSLIKQCATYLDTTITMENPILEGEFPLDGSRFAALLPPIVHRPTFALRRKALKVMTLEQYVENGILTTAQFDILTKAVLNHNNILVVGGTSSGKTTLINAIIAKIVEYFPYERLFIIEDTGEIQCTAENYVQYHTTSTINMTRLLKVSLRGRPDRIFLGETRGKEALDLLMAWNSGHEGGAATVHANNAIDGLKKICMLVGMHEDAPREIEPLVAQYCHIVVFIKKENNKRIVKEIIRVKDFKDGMFLFENL